ncbi:MAG: DUF5698 domain-containing protein [Anaerolineales bacterium]|nr:DUF5698 domain-containing protein [Anaerolineales bacterium]
MDSLIETLRTAWVSALGPLLGPSAPAWTQLPPLLVGLIVFTLRAFDMTLDTLRVTGVARGRRRLVWLVGFVESGIFVIVVSGVLATLGKPQNVAAYAAGFATGTLLGIVLEERLAPGHSLIRIVSPTLGLAIQSRLHAQGYGATYIPGQGQQGAIGLILAYVPRRQVEPVKDLVLGEDASAFMTVEHVRQLRGGWRP